jgi:hypothetical protein
MRKINKQASHRDIRGKPQDGEKTTGGKRALYAKRGNREFLQPRYDSSILAKNLFADSS